MSWIDSSKRCDIAIVTTTIFVPKALRAYMQNVKDYKRCPNVLFVVTGDKKTPSEAQIFCEEISKEFEIECVYQTVDDQIIWLERFPELRDEIPWNSIQRRNLAMLYAYTRQAEVIITIDDDNFFVEGQDFVGDHCAPILASCSHSLPSLPRSTVDSLSSSSGWLNVCDFLQDKRGYEFYARGYPMDQRWPARAPMVRQLDGEERRVVVNAGLWLGDPDVDAITRLTNDIVAEGYKRERGFALAQGTWSPFNSQNTALWRGVLPAYCLSPRIGRYDDIWAGYVVLAVAQHLRHAVAFGFPLVRQERNPHNYFKDHEAERVGLEHTAQLTRWLREMPLTGTDYLSCTKEVLAGLEAHAALEGVAPELASHVRGLVQSYRAWLATLARLDIPAST